MKNKKIIVPLAAIAVLLCLFAAVMMIDGKPNQTETNPAPQPGQTEYIGTLLELDTESITAIGVSTGDGSYTLVKDGDIWSVKDKPKIAISSASVRLLADALGSIPYADVIDDGSVTASDCRIDEKSDFITFTSELGEVTLLRGINTTDGSLAYIMKNDSQSVYMADASHVAKLFSPLAAYRHRAALSIDFENLSKIEIKSKDHIILEKGKTDARDAVYNTWSLTHPQRVGARDEQVQSLITDPLKQINITDFAPDSLSLADCGMGDKAHYVSLADSHGVTARVFFGEGADGSSYINIDGKDTIYKIDPSAAPYMSLGTADVFERNIHLVKMDSISAVTLKGGGYDLEVRFTKDGGTVNGSAVSHEDMNNVVFPTVCGIFADDITSETGGAELCSMTFSYKDGTSDIIRFNDYDQRYCIVSKGNIKYLLLKHKLDAAASSLSGFKE